MKIITNQVNKDNEIILLKKKVNCTYNFTFVYRLFRV